MSAALAGREAVLSCLPYAFNKEVASAAHALGLHYFDLTEDVATTKHIVELTAGARGVMAPQCGLAPGFVGIVGARSRPAVRTLPRSSASGRRAAAASDRLSAMPSTGRPRAW